MDEIKHFHLPPDRAYKSQQLISRAQTLNRPRASRDGSGHLSLFPRFNINNRSSGNVLAFKAAHFWSASIWVWAHADTRIYCCCCPVLKLHFSCAERLAHSWSIGAAASFPAQVFDFQPCRTNSFIVRWIKRGYRAGRGFPLCALNMPRSFLVKKVKLDDFSSTELESTYGRSRTDLRFRIHDKGKCKGMLIHFDLALFYLIQAEF